MRASQQLSLVVLFVCALLSACSQREEVPNRPLRQRGIAQGKQPLPAAEERERERDFEPEPALLPLTETTPGFGADPATNEPETVLPAEQAAPEEAEKPARNLSRELESMMGSPVSCLQQRTAAEAPASVRIGLSASVMPSGSVGRTEVSAPGLAPEEIRCLQKRLEALQFAQPIDNAPLTVTGSITLTRGS
jgi:hypothetical protein